MSSRSIVTEAGRAPRSSTKDYLLATFGAYTGYAGLAKILGDTWSKEGLRVSLSRLDTDFARRLNEAKRRAGRRVLFDVALVADILHGSAVSERREDSAAIEENGDG